MLHVCGQHILFTMASLTNNSLGFYLIDPPPDALHKPIPPSKIVIAGDSAGGGLCIAALSVLRDMGLEQPAGAVLISPWVDLTHSFPSVMRNTATVSRAAYTLYVDHHSLIRISTSRILSHLTALFISPRLCGHFILSRQMARVLFLRRQIHLHSRAMQTRSVLARRGSNSKSDRRSSKRSSKDTLLLRAISRTRM